jgi:SAM-dependent methyltransferase
MSDNWAGQFTAADRQLTEIYETVMAPNLFDPWAEVLADALAPAAGATVVDVATGPGSVARAVARRVGVIGRVIGCDVSPGMLASARAHAAESRAAPIDYQLCPADALTIEDGVADGVTCQHGLQFFPDRVAALAEMRRISRPGGRLAVAVWSPIKHSPLFAGLANGIGEIFGPDTAAAYVAGPWSLTDPVGLRSLAAQAGWHEIQVLPRELPIEFSGGAGQLVASLGITPLAGPVAALSQERYGELVDAVAQALGPALDVDGAVRSATVAQFLIAVA